MNIKVSLQNIHFYAYDVYEKGGKRELTLSIGGEGTKFFLFIVGVPPICLPIVENALENEVKE